MKTKRVKKLLINEISLKSFTEIQFQCLSESNGGDQFERNPFSCVSFAARFVKNLLLEFFQKGREKFYR